MTAIAAFRIIKLFQPCSRTFLTTTVRYTEMSEDYWKTLIGDREIVGPGINCEPDYFDDGSVPCPAIRFQPNTPYVQALREKEKCDWRNLTIEEKKCLYRASFCQTYAEFLAPTGQWKSILGGSLIGLSVALWAVILIKLFILPPMPSCYKDPMYYAHQIKRLIDIEFDFLDGISSKWDYDNNCWKPGYTNKYYQGEDLPDE